MMKKLVNRIRYEFLYHFFPNYIIHNLENRKGKCKKCGKCCNNCKFLKNNKCKVFEDRTFYNPMCRIFPIDERDKNCVNKKCGYYWATQKK